MENLKICKCCKHWKFMIAYKNQYIGSCRVKKQHAVILNGNEEGCILFKNKINRKGLYKYE